MDTGDWRYSRGGDSLPWTEPSADPAPTPDLWADTDTDTWPSTASWLPRHQADATGPSPISPSPVGPAPTSPPVTRDGSYGNSSGGYPSSGSSAYPTSGSGGFGAAWSGAGGYPIRGYGSAYTPAHPAPQYGVPATPAPVGRASLGIPPATGTAPAGAPPPPGATPIGTAPLRRPGLAAADPRSRLAAAARHRGRTGEEPKAAPDANPGYGRVLGFTGAWYAVPVVLYLLWLVIAAGDREAVAGRQFIDGVPWILGAGLISAGLAALLRRITFGWGAIGVSFAAAVIGAGLATITHSFA